MGVSTSQEFHVRREEIHFMEPRTVVPIAEGAALLARRYSGCLVPGLGRSAGSSLLLSWTTIEISSVGRTLRGEHQRQAKRFAQ
jgi:hypothetical protein